MNMTTSELSFVISAARRALTAPRGESAFSTTVLMTRRFLSLSNSVNAKGKQHIVVALGGNALLKRGEPLSMLVQRKNIAEGMRGLAPILQQHTATIVHGNGPQVGLLALMGAAYQKESGVEQMELDVLDAETEGMIGYLIEQELHTHINPERGMVTLLSQIVVDPRDPAFDNPTKFIGPVYSRDEITNVKGVLKQDGDFFRRVVASPLPVRLIDQQMHAVKLLTAADAIVICAGGGGIPVVEDPQTKQLKGVEAVIDKDRAASMMGRSLKADGLLILTDVTGVAIDFGRPTEKWIRSISPERLTAMKEHFPPGSMGPKTESAVEFVIETGGWSAIASLREADKILAGRAGTLVTSEYGPDHVEFY